jgi:hypothetical protein
MAEPVGVEIYRRNLQASGEFQNPSGDCGSIVLRMARIIAHRSVAGPAP